MAVQKRTCIHLSSSASTVAPTFLIAHPREVMRRRLRQTLKAAGYRRSMAVENGSQALDELRLKQSILIAGLDLAVLDCWQLLRMIRSGAFCSATLPVIVTGDARLSGVAEPMAREGGAYFLTESDLDALPQIVARCLDGPPQKTPVLLVEDDEKTARMMDRRLSDRFRVELAFTGEDALRAWEVRQHPLILLDLILPDMRGAVVLQHVMAVNPMQLVVVITALGERATHRALMEAGAVDFLLKPVNLLELPYFCEQLLRGYRDYRRQRTGVEQRQILDRLVRKRALAAGCLLESGRPGLAREEVNHILAAQNMTETEEFTDDDHFDLLDLIVGAAPSTDPPYG